MPHFCLEHDDPNHLCHQSSSRPPSEQPCSSATSCSAIATKSLSWFNESGRSNMIAMSTANHNIGKNIAGAGSTQFNIIINNIDNNANTPVVGDLAAFLHSLHSFPHSEMMRNPHSLRDGLPRRDDPSQRQNQNQPNYKASQHFSVLEPFRNDFEQASAYFREHQGGDLWSRYYRHQLEIDQWAAQDLNLITRYGCRDEMTKHTFEIVELIDQGIRQSQLHNAVRLVHLCGEQSDLKNGNPRIMVLDLLCQLIQYQEKFGGQACSRDDMDEMENADLKSLWDIFWARVREAGIQMLFIFLDNIDELFPETFDSTEAELTREAIGHLVNNLEPPKSQSGIVVKAMVTCNTKGMEDYFRGNAP